MSEELQVALTRTLQFHPTDGGPIRDVVVTIGLPRPHGEDFDATLTIEGFERPYRKDLGGADPIQALLAAVHLAPDLLRTMERQYHGRLTWLDGDDLGFLPSASMMDVGPAAK